MHLGQLLAMATHREPKRGKLKGRCVICGRETEEGLPPRSTISQNFTGWSYLYTGEVMCPLCAFLFSDQTFRKKSWVASQQSFATFPNSEAISVLFNPPQPPFFIYIAKQGRRQSWLSSIHRVALNRSRFFFAYEPYDTPILFERMRAEKYHQLALQLLQLAIPKGEIISLSFSPKSFEKAFLRGQDDLLREAEQYKNDPLWEVIADVSRTGGSSG